MFHQYSFLTIFFVVYLIQNFDCYSFKAKTVTNITKLATYHYQSNCVIFLYTRENLLKNSKQIRKIVNGLANDLKYSATVAGVTFSRFDEACVNGADGATFLNCNSPLLLIIHSDDRTKQALEKMSKEYVIQNAFWLIYLKSSQTHAFFKEIKTPFDLQIIVAHIHNEEFAEFSEVYRVAESWPLRTPPLGQWTMQYGLELPTEILFQRRNNLEGIVLNTGSTENYPIHYWDHSGSKPELKGYFPEVWKQMEITLNFTSVNFPSIDNVTGMPEKNGNWSGLVGMLQNRKIDVAVSDFIMDTQRVSVIDFSRPLLKSSYQIFFKNVGNDFNWYSILRPFDGNIWLTIFFWIVIGSCSLTVCHSYSCRSGVEKHLRLDDFDPINSALFLTKALCNQGHTFIPSCIASRIIYLCAYLAACVLIPSYSAALISYLTSKTPKRPFDSLNELLQDGTYRLQTNSKTAEYTYFSEASDEKLRGIYDKLIRPIPQNQLPLNTREGLQKVCSSNHLAHFGDMEVASPYLSARNREATCEIMYFSQPISTVYSCMALTRNNPYTKVINHFLHKMEDTGIIDVIHDRTFPIVPKIKPSGWSEVEINDVILIFIILLFGMILSWIIFLIELYCWKIQKVQQQKEKNQLKYYFKKSHLRRWDYF